MAKLCSEGYLNLNMGLKASVKSMEGYGKATLLQNQKFPDGFFFLVPNLADIHRTKGMGLKSGQSINSGQWSSAETVKLGVMVGVSL